MIKKVRNKIKGGEDKKVFKVFTPLKGILMTVLRITVMILSILLIFGFFRWSGIKGFLSFLLGMGIMAYLLLSKNMMFQMIIETFGAVEYIDEVKKKK